MHPFIDFMNDGGKAFVDAAGLMLIQSSVLITILLGLDLVLRKRTRAVFRYWLWVLVLIKLVLPGGLALPYSLGYWVSDTIDIVEASLPQFVDTPSYPRADSKESSLQPVVEWTPYRHVWPTETSVLSAVHAGPDSPGRMGSIPERAIGHSPASSASVYNSTTTQAEVMQAAFETLSWQGGLFGLWALACVGAACLVLYKTLLVQKLVRQGRAAHEDYAELFASCCRRMHMQRQVRLRILPMVPAPAVYGLFRPVVLVPERLIAHGFAHDELRAIFIHELTHIQRGDLWVRLLQTILQVVYFYNPLIWLANARIRRVREQAVDETVLVALGAGAGELYPRTLLEVAGWAFDRPLAGLRLLGVMESKGVLTERINIMLNKPIPSSQKIGVTGMMGLALMGAFLLPMAWADEAGSADVVSIVSADAGPAEAVAEARAAGRSDTEAVAESAPARADDYTLSVTNEAKPTQPTYVDRAPVSRAQDRVRADIAKRKADIRTLEQQIDRLQQQLRRQLAALQQEEKGLISQYSDAARQPRAPRPARTPSTEAPSAFGRTRSTRSSRGRASSASTIRPPQQDAPSYGVYRSRRPETSSDELRNELREILPELLRQILPQLLKEAMTEAAGEATQPAGSGRGTRSRYGASRSGDAYGFAPTDDVRRR